ncbi:EAL domain-containing protein [Neobacillus drentensis]|uniref:putative bifunctional diguanylate cyclase/phosphodiesterase n=1 Tax=Neobacillus drentensis TaxID=220684 RepID=UPI001F29679B|nr:EAL domain-containing protein [Neobacillus drentensis]ULT56071.1 EAL domain-containing protein [Neobacillus drentensis]
MSIKKKLPLIFFLLVLFILLANNTFHYLWSKNQLLEYNEREISVITNEVSFQVEKTREGSLYVENILGRDLRIASLAIKQSLPPTYQQISNDQLKKLASEVRVSHITLLAKTRDDIIGVRSSDPEEINMSTKGWGYWYDAYQQLLALKPVNVGKGLTLPHYWSGPIEIASSDPDHIDKWGYYYDGTTNYIINPYFRDNEVLEFEQRFGPGKIIEGYTKERGILEISVFNPKNFGKKSEVVHLNGNSYIRISARPIWYGSYKFRNIETDAAYIKKAIKTKKVQSYNDTLNKKSVLKTFVPVSPKSGQPFVIGLVYNYGLIQDELRHELFMHILLSLVIMLIVLIVSFIFSRSITEPIGYIVEQVNEIAQGNFGKHLHVNRKDELGLLTENVNAMSTDLHRYVEDLQQSKTLIEYQANHDPLTGLLNRRFLQEKLNSIMIEAEENNEAVSVLFIDMDRFKQVNDSYGHNKGDELLNMIAARIKDGLDSDNSILIRQGGDEFIILLLRHNHEETKAAADRLIDILKKPYMIDGNEFYLGASIGISRYPEHTSNMDTLISYADMAMYNAKKNGGNKAIFYSEKSMHSTIDRPRLEAHLRRAIENKKIDVFYQPKIKVDTGVVFGAEALVRWTDEEFGNVSPVIFIPIAEETGFIQPLWELVMTKACEQVSKWNQTRSHPLTVSVNFSARQFQEPDLMLETVKRILAEKNLPPHLFEIEITESILLNNSSEIVQSLQTLQNQGISISIDDFGTGYSSLSYLKDLPINTLKIDQTFIQNINESLENTEIPEAIISLARGLHLDVIAEGVEKEYQKEFLLSRNCVLMQGYLFSKPLSSPEFEKFLVDFEK